MNTKRLLDVGGSLVALVFAAPVLAIVAAAVRIAMGSPVLFRQVRVGAIGRLFTLYKVRTMKLADHTLDSPQPDSQRITRIGSWIRDASLDELPQFWNVLRGDMSLVGPRPLLPQYLPLYSDFQRRRHEVKPGITGWAQVNGRNALTWEERFELDVWYVDHRSFWLDVRILLRTVLQVLKRDGISGYEHATMPEFTGTTKAR
jgi:sugar transferase EpsL